MSFSRSSSSVVVSRRLALAFGLALTAAGPPPTITMGLGVGTPSGDTCTLSSANAVTAAAGTTPQLAATAPAGTYCVQVFDVGNQVAPVAYTLTVAHP